MQPRYQPTSVTHPLPSSAKAQVAKAIEQQPCAVQTNVNVTVINQGTDWLGGLFGGLWTLVAWFFAIILVMTLFGWVIQNPWVAAALVVVCGGFYAIVQLITRN